MAAEKNVLGFIDASDGRPLRIVGSEAEPGFGQGAGGSEPAA
jgi:hypothetical protein